MKTWMVVLNITEGTMPVFWLILLAVLLVIELATMGLTTIWFAGGSLAAFLGALLGAPIWLQVLLFIIVSVVMLIFTRPIAVKYMNKKVEKTNVESIPGKTAVVVTEIDPLTGTGQVLINGIEWSAKSNDGKVIESGSVVKILSVEGVKVIVEEEHK